MKTIPDILFYSGNGHHRFGAEMLYNLNELLGTQSCFSHTDFEEFPDEESDARFPNFKNIRDKPVIFYQSIYNAQLFMEALQSIWSLKMQYRAIYLIAVIPFMIYRRQDHLENQTEVCRLKMAIDFLKAAGVNELISVTPHSEKMKTFSHEDGIKFHEVDLSSLFVSRINTYLSDPPLVYSPDAGSIPRAIKIARLLNSQIIFSLKNRGLNNNVEIKMDEEAEIKATIKFYQAQGFQEINFADSSTINGASIVMVEDEVSTGSTANQTGCRLRQLGAKKIIFLATHPVLVRGWRRKLFDNNPFTKIIMSNTIPRNYEKMTGGLIDDVSAAPLTAEILYKVLKQFNLND